MRRLSGGELIRHGFLEDRSEHLSGEKAGEGC